MLLTILLASSLASIADLFGWLLFLRADWVRRALRFLLAFAAGVLLAAAFLEIIPEGLEQGAQVFWVLLGIILFYLLEKGLILYHCHDERCDIHAGPYLMIIGDFIHDLLDGVIIALAFLISFPLGFVTTLATALHEIPAGFSSFAVLLVGSPSRFLLWTFIIVSSLAAPLGALLTYLARGLIEPWLGPLLLVAAGGFIYIAAVDLIPETHKEYFRPKSIGQVILFLLGIASIYLLGLVL